MDKETRDYLAEMERRLHERLDVVDQTIRGTPHEGQRGLVERVNLMEGAMKCLAAAVGVIGTAGAGLVVARIWEWLTGHPPPQP